MEELWLNWSHLGVDDCTKVNNITKLVLIEKELHRDVISETRGKLKTMQAQVDSEYSRIHLVFLINMGLLAAPRGFTFVNNDKNL